MEGLNPKGERFPAPLQTSRGAHPAYCTMGIGSVSLAVKWLRRDIDHQPPSSAEVKEGVNLYPYFPSEPSWHVLG